MTKQEALTKSYCKHCSAYWGLKGKERQHCRPVSSDKCLLDDETIKRWRKEHGLKG